MSVSFFSVSACDLFGYVPKSRFQTAVRAHTGVKHSVPEADLACPDMYQKTREKGLVCLFVFVLFITDVTEKDPKHLWFYFQKTSSAADIL